MCIECITDPLVTVDDVMTVISQLNNSAAGHDSQNMVNPCESLYEKVVK